MKKTGMTLIEVILAVTILSLGLSVLLSAAVKCLAVMKIAGRYQVAQWTRGLGDLEHPILEIEEIEDAKVDEVEYGEGYLYSREVDDDEDEDGLYVVRTRVSWSEGERDVLDEVVRYVWHPEED